ncbi:unnamed protein product [Choristocarpus tenellus]
MSWPPTETSHALFPLYRLFKSCTDLSMSSFSTPSCSLSLGTTIKFMKPVCGSCASFPPSLPTAPSTVLVRLISSHPSYLDCKGGMRMSHFSFPCYYCFQLCKLILSSLP